MKPISAKEGNAMRFEALTLAMLSLSCLAHVASAQSFVLARKGQPQVAILLLEKAKERLMPIAQELQRWLGEIIGNPPAIETATPNKVGILLGTAKEFPDLARRYRLSELGNEGFVIRSEKNQLLLLANTDLGLRHAVYAFLEHIGCRWFFPDPVWTVVPKQPNLTVQLNLRAKPAFRWRHIWYGWGPRTPKLAEDYEAWMQRNRQYGDFPVDCGHAYERYIPHREFEKHPEWFALVGGKRQPTQLCVSNPEVQQRVIEGVLQLFRRDPNRLMASVEPNDGGGYCECENCKTIGSPSDQAFFFANKVAEAIRNEFPDKFVGLYAYAYHSDPPKFRLLPNVYVEVTTGFRYTRLTFDEQVQAFRKLGATVGVYDYFSVYPWDFDLPGAAKAGRVYELANAIKHYHKLGMVSYTAESSCNWGPNGLGYWVAAKLMWQPDLDAKALVRDFCEKAFGKAAEPMRRLYERWAKGERFSARGLLLAMQDLQEAYQRESDPQVQKRLNRIAMYLHLLRLWLDYDRTSRWNQWGKLVAPSEEVIAKAKECVVFARRIMDTGLVHTFPMLFTEWFDQRFAALKRIDGFDFKQTEAWKTERTDIPSDEEVRQLFDDDLQWLKRLVPIAVEIEGRKFVGNLVSIAQRLPQAVKAWGDVERSPLFVESGIHYFVGRKGETLSLTYTPFDAGHTVDCKWTLRRLTTGKLSDDAIDGQLIAQGTVKAEKGKPATVTVTLPADGVYAFDPGTDYWKAAQVEFDRRPLSVWCGRFDEPGKVRRVPLRLWLPRGEPLYFFVPKGTKHFVIGIVSGGDPKSVIELRTADGTVIRREGIVAGDQISVIVEQDVREYGEISEMAKQAILPGEQLSVIVPKGKDGQIWALRVWSLRCVVELYDVPPFTARHPSELLVPEDALK
jgi:hypothetical protein